MSPNHAIRVYPYVRFRTDPCSGGDYGSRSVAGALSVQRGCGGRFHVDGPQRPLSFSTMTPDDAAPVWMRERSNGLLAGVAGRRAGSRRALSRAGCRCRSAGRSTSRAAAQRRLFPDRPPSCRCSTSWRTARRRRSPWSATRASSACRCSWAARRTPSRAVVQSAGHAYRLKAQLLKEEFDRGGALQHLLLRYTQALITQMSQTAVCNRHHSVDQQLCRWLLLSLDRLPSQRARR